MPANLPTLIPRLLVAWVFQRAQDWLGAAGLDALDAAMSPADEAGPLANLQTWLKAEDTARHLLQAARQAEAYVQQHCTEPEICEAATLRFADLPAVQQALNDLPHALDAQEVTTALRQALARDFPHLSPAQVERLANLYTEGLERALLTFEPLALPILGQAVLDLRAQQEQGFARLAAQLDAILAKLNASRLLTAEEQATLDAALREGQVLVYGDVRHSVIIVGQHNTVALDAEHLTQLGAAVPLPGALPPGSFLPFPRNGAFTGREEALTTLAQTLLAEGRSAVIAQAVTGLGGVGKTQLAVEFAYRYGYRFVSVHWLDLSDPDQLDEYIARNGEHLGLTPWPQERPLQVQATLRA